MNTNVHWNGYGIAGLAVPPRIPHTGLEALPTGCGHRPDFVARDDPAGMRQRMARVPGDVIDDRWVSIPLQPACLAPAVMHVHRTRDFDGQRGDHARELHRPAGRVAVDRHASDTPNPSSKN